MNTKNPINTKKTINIELMDCVSGTATSSDAMALFIKLESAIKAKSKVRLSLKNATVLTSSFLNASFGEIYDKYGYSAIQNNIVLVNYLPSQAKAIKKYLGDVKKLVR